MPTTADAVTRETAWLTTSGDGLPALLATAGGPFDLIQAYFPRTPSMEQRSLFVIRQRIRQARTANVRQMSTYPFLLRIQWPILDVTGNAEAEQQALDNAVELVFQRVSGPVFDKTHGGRFLSVAENPRATEATFRDPMITLPTLNALLVDITYSADDPETTG
jgi:hypothetical protein